MEDGAGLSVNKGRRMNVRGKWAYSYGYVKPGGTAGSSPVPANAETGVFCFFEEESR